MTTIPDAAIEAAEKAFTAHWHSDRLDRLEGFRAALTAAAPHLYAPLLDDLRELADEWEDTGGDNWDQQQFCAEPLRTLIAKWGDEQP
jgi:hypothetical protein